MKLIYGSLNTQINLGIRIQEADKQLGGKMASETLVRQREEYLID